MSLLKVLDGTPRGDAPFLCKSCQFSVCIKGAEGQEYIKCNVLTNTITFKVIECNNYLSKKDPSLGAMESIAWVVVTKGTRVMGFERLIDRQRAGKEYPYE
jgi:hypothetical protein